MSGIVYDFKVHISKSLETPISHQLGVMGNLVLRLTSRLPDNIGHKVYFDNLLCSTSLLQHLQDQDIWCVSTICAN